MTRLKDCLIVAGLALAFVIAGLAVVILLAIPVVVLAAVLAVKLIVVGIADATDELTAEEEARQADQPCIDIDHEEAIAPLMGNPDDFRAWERQVAERG